MEKRRKIYWKLIISLIIISLILPMQLPILTQANELINNDSEEKNGEAIIMYSKKRY